MEIQNYKDMEAYLIPVELQALPPRVLLRALKPNKPYVVATGTPGKLRSKGTALRYAAKKIPAKLIFSTMGDKLIMMIIA